MEKLLAYLNALTTREQGEFARAVGTSIGYLRKACSKKQVLGADLCVSIEEASHGRVTRRELRSDWARVWPELRDQGPVVKLVHRAAVD